MKNTITPKKHERVNINRVEIYYEVYGKGEPLILLHGYTQSSIAWLEYVKEYSDNFEVYLIDLRGHGKSSKFEYQFSVRAASEDVLTLMKHLNIDKVKGIGLSFGGDVLLELSSMNPELVESMVIIGANGNWDSQDFPSMLSTFNYDNIEKFQWIRDYHTGGEEQIKGILDQLANYKIKLTDEELKRIKAKTLLILGDKAEQIPIDSVVKLHQTLDDSQLWIVPNTGHYAHDGDNKTEFLRLSKAFLLNTLK
ncbi:alpha/beta fold hydrolase [Tenacibaculum caenipelagi]|uniref:Pimeloyl-ACP methyl ester carboxylesterase n=1 Tax=Tenacibaculum caenipelagi TaxID=1325435 RepID=A0A4R6TIC8_9FLAO|nr:alpha/beta hydrolase [Tenacibaculum caenipelagi]TDQ27591.1 pimeloyl-ACP methyl ester carboxylesterase [Tenacibaculum caenipelagi]